MKKLIFVLALILKSSLLLAAPPATCNIGAGYYDITTTTVTLYFCTNTNVWTSVSANSLLPSGSIIGLITGTCPVGFTELTALNGKFLRGTIAANGNVGQTGGNDTITPTVASLSAAAQTFTGTPFSGVINHTHTISPTLNVQGGTTAAVTGTHIMTSTATGGSARAIGSGDVVAATSANPSGGVASITPAGTNGSSNVTGTLNSFDNKPAYVNIIFCSKN